MFHGLTGLVGPGACVLAAYMAGGAAGPPPRWPISLHLTTLRPYIGRMNTDIDKLLKEALGLPSEARAALAGVLIDSLDDTLDSDAETAWAEEVTRRLREIDQGQARTIPWSEARASILADVRTSGRGPSGRARRIASSI
jgi:putative addiction module component (TIGR02574 family)